MDEIYGFNSLMSPDNLMIPAEYNQYNYDYMIESEELGFHSCSVVSESANSVNVVQNRREVVDHEDEHSSSFIKAKIASHPSYPKLLDAYIDCQKVGAPPEISCLLEEIRREKALNKHEAISMCVGADPELDEFMETYCEILVKYKTDLTRPFDEATSFLDKIQTQLANLICKDDGRLSSDDEFSGGETEIQDPQMKTEDRELKDRLFRMYGSHINSLKLEFSKKKKKGKLPKDARQTLLEWWNVHYKWPYPTEGDKILLAEATGLDQKQINNWFINQRKRHWKPSENMHLAIMDNLSGHFFMED